MPDTNPYSGLQIGDKVTRANALLQAQQELTQETGGNMDWSNEAARTAAQNLVSKKLMARGLLPVDDAEFESNFTKKGFTDTDWSQAADLFGAKTAFDAGATVGRIATINSAKGLTPDQMTPQQQEATAWALEQQAQSNRPMGGGYVIGSGIANLIPFGVEMAATGGTASAVKAGAKTAIRKGIGAISESAAEMFAKQMARETAEQSIRKIEREAVKVGERAGAENAIRLAGTTYDAAATAPGRVADSLIRSAAAKNYAEEQGIDLLRETAGAAVPAATLGLKAANLTANIGSSAVGNLGRMWAPALRIKGQANMAMTPTVEMDAEGKAEVTAPNDTWLKAYSRNFVNSYFSMATESLGEVLPKIMQFTPWTRAVASAAAKSKAAYLPFRELTRLQQVGKIASKTGFQGAVPEMVEEMSQKFTNYLLTKGGRLTGTEDYIGQGEEDPFMGGAEFMQTAAVLAVPSVFWGGIARLGQRRQAVRMAPAIEDHAKTVYAAAKADMGDEFQQKLDALPKEAYKRISDGLVRARAQAGGGIDPDMEMKFVNTELDRELGLSTGVEAKAGAPATDLLTGAPVAPPTPAWKPTNEEMRALTTEHVTAMYETTLPETTPERKAELTARVQEVAEKLKNARNDDVNEWNRLRDLAQRPNAAPEAVEKFRAFADEVKARWDGKDEAWKQVYAGTADPAAAIKAAKGMALAFPDTKEMKSFYGQKTAKGAVPAAGSVAPPVQTLPIPPVPASLRPDRPQELNRIVPAAAPVEAPAAVPPAAPVLNEPPASEAQPQAASPEAAVKGAWTKWGRILATKAVPSIGQVRTRWGVPSENAGVSVDDSITVSDKLSPQAAEFVALHEMYHNSEMARWIAANKGSHALLIQNNLVPPFIEGYRPTPVPGKAKSDKLQAKRSKEAMADAFAAWATGHPVPAEIVTLFESLVRGREATLADTGVAPVEPSPAPPLESLPQPIPAVPTTEPQDMPVEAPAGAVEAVQAQDKPAGKYSVRKPFKLAELPPVIRHKTLTGGKFEFENPVDKAALLLAQNPDRADAKTILRYALGETGLDADQIRAYGEALHGHWASKRRRKGTVVQVRHGVVPLPTPQSGSVEERPVTTLPARAQVPAATPARHVVEGKRTTVTLADNSKVDAVYAVVPLEMLQVSHKPDGTPNPQYAISGAQGRTDVKTGRENYLGKYDAGRVINNSTGPDGMPGVQRSTMSVIFGNGRVNTLREGIEMNIASAVNGYSALRDSDAAMYGIDPAEVERIKQTGQFPVLVRLIDTDNATAVKIGQLSNAPDIAPMSKVELARTIGEGLSISDVADNLPEEINSPKSARWLRKIMQDRGYAGNLSVYVGNDGTLTDEGVGLVRTIVASKVLGDDTVVIGADPYPLALAAFSEKYTGGESALENLLIPALRTVAAVEKQERGVPKEWDIMDDIRAAVTVVLQNPRNDAAHPNGKVWYNSLFNQADVFGQTEGMVAPESLSPRAKDMLYGLMVDKPGLIRDAMNAYYETLDKSFPLAGGAELFGFDAVTNPEVAWMGDAATVGKGKDLREARLDLEAKSKVTGGKYLLASSDKGPGRRSMNLSNAQDVERLTRTALPMMPKIEFRTDNTGHPDNAEGYYDEASGKAIIFLKNIRHPGELIRVMLHETIGHAGIDAVLGDKGAEFKERLWNTRPEVREWFAKSRYAKDFDTSTAKGRVDAASEWLARRVETGDVPAPLWNRIVSYFRDALRKVLGPRAGVALNQVTDAEIKALVKEAYGRAAGKEQIKGGGAGGRYSLGEEARSAYLDLASRGDNGGDDLQALLDAARPEARAKVVEAWLARNPKAKADMEKAVDEAAKGAGYAVGPVWHGTDKYFWEFSIPRQPGEGRTRDPNTFIGAHFTESKNTAERFAGGLYGGEKQHGRVIQARLHITNPLMVGKGAISEQTAQALDAQYEKARKRLDDHLTNRSSQPNDALVAAVLSGDQSAIDAALEDPIGDELQKAASDALRARMSAEEANRPVTETEIYEAAGLDRDAVFAEWERRNSSVRYAEDIGRKLRDALLASGYDGVFYRNSVEAETGITGNKNTWIAMHPGQIKTTDPVTFDDRGRIIPLEERFKATSPDIRYSLGDTAPGTVSPEARAKVDEDEKTTLPQLLKATKNGLIDHALTIIGKPREGHDTMDDRPARDISRGTTLYRTINYWGEGVPQAMLAYEAASQLHIDKSRLLTNIFRADYAAMTKWQKQNPARYRLFHTLINDRDVAAKGGHVVGADGSFTATDPDGKILGVFSDREKAWEAVFQAERDGVESSHGKDIADMVMLYRQMNRRSFLIMSAEAEQMADAAEKAGDKSLAAQIREKVAQMGDLSGSYMHRHRSEGSYMLESRKEGTRPDLKKFPTPEARAIYARIMQDKGYTTKNIANDRLSETQYQNINLGWLATTMQDWMDKAEKGGEPLDAKLAKINGRVFVEAIVQSIQQRGALSMRMRRSEGDVYTGYETDPVKALGYAANAVAGGQAKREAVGKIIRAISGTDKTFEQFVEEHPDVAPEKRDEAYREYVKKRKVQNTQPRLREALMGFLENIQRNDSDTDRVVNFFKSAVALKYMASLSSPIVNLTSMLTSGPALISAEHDVSIPRAFKLIAQGGKDYVAYQMFLRDPKAHPLTGMSPLRQSIQREIYEAELDAPQFNREATAAIQGKFAGVWNDIIEKHLILFSITEKFNRGATAAAAIMAQAQNAGIKDGDQIGTEFTKAAHRTIGLAHAEYGKESRFAWTYGDSLGAHFGKMFLMFKTYGWNYIQSMARLVHPPMNEEGVRGPRKLKQAGYMLLAPMVLGGAGAIPLPALVPEIGKWIMEAFGLGGGDDPAEKFYAWLAEQSNPTVARTVRYGVPSIMGVSLQGGMAMSGLDVPIQISSQNWGGKKDVVVNVLDLMGPLGGISKDMYSTAVNLGKGDFLRAAETFLPRVYAAPIKAYREGTEGVTTQSGRPVWWGEERLRPDYWQSVVRGLGFSPVGITEKRDLQFAETQRKGVYEKRKKAIMDEFKDAAMMPDSAEKAVRLRNLLLDSRDYNLAVRDSVVPGLAWITEDTIKNAVKRSQEPSLMERRRAQRKREMPRLGGV